MPRTPPATYRQGTDLIEADLKKLTATLAAMAAKLGNDKNRSPNSGNNNDGAKDGTSRRPQMKKLRNMGG